MPDFNANATFTDTKTETAESASAVIELTLLQNATGEPVSKTIWRDPVTGDVNKIPGAQIWEGQAWRVNGVGAKGLAWRLAQTKAHELLLNAQLRCDTGDPAVPVRVVLKDYVAANPGSISRSPEFFSLPAGQPGCLPIDVDYKGISAELKGMIDYLSPWGALCEVFPGLKGTARVERLSCGGGLLWQGQPLPDSGGMHIWPMIKDASDAPRSLAVALKRCVLADLYWCRISSRGVVQVRSLIDLALKNIAQPIYEGAPYLAQPELTQNRTMQFSEGKLVDTRVVFPDLTAVEEARYEKIIKEERAKLEPEAAVAREEYVIRHATVRARANGRPTPDQADFAAAQRVYSGGETIILTASTPLLLDNRALGENGIVTVREVLRSPKFFVGQTLADPLDWEDGRGRAILYSQRDGGLLIHSFSHGEANYLLRWELSDVELVIDRFKYGWDSVDKFLHNYADIATRAELEPADRKRLNARAAEVAGCNKTRVNKALEKNIQERAALREPINPDTADLLPWERQNGLLERVAELNQDYAHVLVKGKGFVYYKSTNTDTRYTGWTSVAAGTFNEVISGPKYFRGPDVKLHNTAFCWLQHSRRRYYSGGVDMDSKAEPDPNVLNMWEGFAFEPVPGDWSKTKKFIEEVVCSGTEEHYAYLLNHMAWKVQNPTERTEMAKVFRGLQGIGKSFFMHNVFGPLFGRHFISLERPDQLVGRFNDHMMNACVVFADEAFFTGDKAAADVLLGLVTAPNIRIEGKFRSSFPAKNRIDLWVASNRDHVIPAPPGARRWFVPTFAETYRSDIAYFKELDTELKSGGHGAMLFDLLQRDLTGFDQRKILITPGLIEQKEHDLTPFARWWGDVLMQGGLRPDLPWRNWILTSELFESYQRHEDRSRPYHKMSLYYFGRAMTKLTIPSRPRPGTPDEKRGSRGYAVGESLAIAQAHFNTTFEVNYEWPVISESDARDECTKATCTYADRSSSKRGDAD